ncbi:MAG: YdeI/OmpD-associated family protein [Gemmatimonadales bacterium]
MPTSSRFTPRKPTSTWSTVNTRRVAELENLGLMHPAGLQAFSHRNSHRSGIYSFEQARPAKLARPHQAQLRANPRAWKFFSSQPPWYRRAMAWWVSSAKREETRLKRLSILIADSEQGRTIPPLTRKKS